MQFVEKLCTSANVPSPLGIQKCIPLDGLSKTNSMLTLKIFFSEKIRERFKIMNYSLYNNISVKFLVPVDTIFIIIIIRRTLKPNSSMIIGLLNFCGKVRESIIKWVT